jgi:hypothetical protein
VKLSWLMVLLIFLSKALAETTPQAMAQHQALLFIVG